MCTLPISLYQPQRFIVPLLIYSILSPTQMKLWCNFRVSHDSCSELTPLSDTCCFPHASLSCSSRCRPFRMTIGGDRNYLSILDEFDSHRNLMSVARNDDIVVSDYDNEYVVSPGTLKFAFQYRVLNRFETSLFQVDKIPGGARLDFITIGDGKTEVLVYDDCLVFPATGGSGLIFQAIRNGPLKDKSPTDERTIMKGLLQSLQNSVEIARV